MRRTTLFLTLAMSLTCMVSCKDSNNEPTEQQVDNKSKIIGTWESGEYILSFNKEGFYSAYIADEFLDSGDFMIDNNSIVCKNTYFNRETIYNIESVTNESLAVSISYKDNYGNPFNKKLSFNKSDLEPAVKDNPYISKSISWLTDVFGYVTHTFTTYNLITKTATKGSAARHPLTLYYIIIGNKFYYQHLDVHIGQMPTIGGWPTAKWDEVIPNIIKLNENGTIWGFEPLK